MNAQELLKQLDFQPLVLAPVAEVDVFPHSPEDNAELFSAKAKAVEIALEHGLQMPPASEEDKTVARNLFLGNLEATPLTTRSPQAILHVQALLDEYDHVVVKSAQQLRNFITNRLIIETHDANGSVRLRALENLGKITGVNLFSERVEVVDKTHSPADLQQKLREKLEKYVGGSSIADAKAVKQPKIIEE